jgi:biopolymer transport protein ExbD
MKFERYRKTRDEVKIDAIPVMSLFAIIVPIMLLTSTLSHFGTIPTYLPWTNSAHKQKLLEPRTVNVILHVSPQSIRLATTNPDPDGKDTQQVSLTIARTKKGYDLETLQKALYQIKLLYDNSDTIAVLPSDTVQYEQLVEILDAAREVTFHPGTEQEVTIPLFPVVVLSRKG